jgi:Family of unknown function (DUF5906)
MSNADDEEARKIIQAGHIFEDRPHTPLLFPEEKPHRKPIFEEEFAVRGNAIMPDFIRSKEDVYAFVDKTFAKITINGKVRYLREKDNGEIEFLERKDFIAFYEELSIILSGDDKKPKSFPFTELWLKWQDKRNYRNGLTFNPSRVGNYDGFYNLFKGYKVAAREGDCSKFLDYMRDIICSGHEDNYEYLVALIAQMFQKPGHKPGVAVALRGDEGVGKSFFIEKLGTLMGPYYFKTSNPAYIFGDHNGQLKDKLLMHLEEAVYAGSKKEDSLMKDFITGPTLQINDKFIPMYEVPNHLHFFLSGNPDWLVRVGFEARRIFALHVSDAHRVDTEYFAGIDEWFKSGGAEKLMYYFMNYKSDIDLRKVPVTDELIFQKEQNLSPVAEWAKSIGDTLEWPYGELTDNGDVDIIKGLLYYDFCHSPMGRNTRLSESKFGIQFLALFPLVIDGVVQKGGMGRNKSVIQAENIKIRGAHERQNAYRIPKDISIYRSAFEYNLSGKTEWSEGTEWTVLRPNTERIDDIHGKKAF